ncbi:hypothetical protein [Spirosoma gilvum]
MKTSYILLIVITVLTLTGMVATDVLLKQQYEQIDWSNPYQEFEKRPIPNTRHWVIEGTPIMEILVEKSNDKPYVLLEPEQAKFFRQRQVGDTTFVAFTPDYMGGHGEPRMAADYRLHVAMVLRVPNLRQVSVQDGRVTIGNLSADTLAIALTNSRLRTSKLTIANSLELMAEQNSFAVLDQTDRYKTMRTTVRDSSGILLNNTPIETFERDIAPKAEIQLRGQALKWLK